jgi:hypothetical protein
VVCGGVLLAGVCAGAQEAAPVPTTVEEALKQMSDAAGVVFSGEVTAVRRRAGANGGSGVVEVDFRVDQAVKGSAAGSVYTLKEWAGLWPVGVERYRVGQQLLMLLHAPGAGGLSSPVGGMAGAIPVRGTSEAPGMTSGSTVGTPQIADLRWVGTTVLRVVPSQIITGTGQAGPETAGSGTTGSAGDASVAAEQAPVDEVVGMLRAWSSQAGQGQR